MADEEPPPADDTPAEESPAEAETPAEEPPAEEPAGGEGEPPAEGGAEESPPEDASAMSPATTPAASSPRKKHRKKGDLDLQHARIGFLGAGKMAESIVDGLINHGNIPARHIFVAAPSKRNLVRFKEKGCHATKHLRDIFGRYDCDVIFLCFHGSVVANAYKQGGTRPFPILTNFIPTTKHPIYILSLVTGVTLKQIQEVLLNPERKDRYILEMHRVMINTAASFGQGMIAVDCDPDSSKLTPPIRTLLQSLTAEGQSLEYIPESQMDAACALGGSGLAFSYYLLGALADGAVKCGLTRPLALKFASRTALMGAQVLLDSGKHPAELRDDCAAPGGAAIFGLHVLDRNEVNAGITAAVEKAHTRGEELAQAD